MLPDERFGELEPFMAMRRNPVTSSVPMTMHSISLLEGRMRIGGP